MIILNRKKIYYLYIYFIKEFPLRLQNATSFFLGMSEDFFDGLLGKNDPFTPPMFIRLKAGDYWSARYYRMKGMARFKYFIKRCHPDSDAHILDVGCGSGQVASQFLNYLDKEGRYEGMDINRDEIQWCKENIEPVRKNFRFSAVDVYNKIYNPQGKKRAASFRFPYKNNSFDFVILLSVFTHMVPKDLENYLQEIFRVLKKSGQCFITFFLLNRYSLQSLSEKKSTIEFPNKFSYYRVLDINNPECAIAYNEDYIRKIFNKEKFKLRSPIQYGSWPVRKKAWDYQDLIIAQK